MNEKTLCTVAKMAQNRNQKFHQKRSTFSGKLVKKILFYLMVSGLMALSQSLCAQSNSDGESGTIDRNEEIELGKSQNFAHRDETSLSLKLAGGKTKKFVSLTTCSGYEDCVLYIYRGLIASNQFYWVDVRHYEGGTSLLISQKNGEQNDVIDEPHVSPDAKYVVSASDQEAYGPSGVFLWEITDGQLVQRFETGPKENALFRFTAWDNSKTVKLIKITYGLGEFCSKDTAKESSLVETPVRLTLKKSDWQLQELINEKQIKCR